MTADPTGLARRDVTARAIVDSQRHLALGTADAAGAPWMSPVWLAAPGELGA